MKNPNLLKSLKVKKWESENLPAVEFRQILRVAKFPSKTTDPVHSLMLWQQFSDYYPISVPNLKEIFTIFLVKILSLHYRIDISRETLPEIIRQNVSAVFREELKRQKGGGSEESNQCE